LYVCVCVCVCLLLLLLRFSSEINCLTRRNTTLLPNGNMETGNRQLACLFAVCQQRKSATTTSQPARALAVAVLSSNDAEQLRHHAASAAVVSSSFRREILMALLADRAHTRNKASFIAYRRLTQHVNLSSSVSPTGTRALSLKWGFEFFNFQLQNTRGDSNAIYSTTVVTAAMLEVYTMLQQLNKVHVRLLQTDVCGILIITVEIHVMRIS